MTLQDRWDIASSTCLEYTSHPAANSNGNITARAAPSHFCVYSYPSVEHSIHATHRFYRLRKKVSDIKAADRWNIISLIIMSMIWASQWISITCTNIHPTWPVYVIKEREWLTTLWCNGVSRNIMETHPAFWGGISRQIMGVMVFWQYGKVQRPWLATFLVL